MENTSLKECEIVRDYLYKSFPSIIKNEISCPEDQIRIIRPTWGTDPLFKGSYSFIKVGSTVNDIINLSQPILIKSN